MLIRRFCFTVAMYYGRSADRIAWHIPKLVKFCSHAHYGSAGPSDTIRKPRLS